MVENKPIIIDKVDVNGCKLYRDEISFVGGEIYTDVCSIWIWQRDYSGLEPSCVMKCHCEDNPNCYFKQCARAKNKIDYMEEDIKIVENARNDLERELKRKEQECEELQKTANAYNYLVKLANYRLDKIEDLQQQLDQLKAENEILKEKLVISSNSDKKTLKIIQTLTEIKEIAEYEFKELMNAEDYHNMTEVLKQILQKISEVSNDR